MLNGYRKGDAVVLICQNNALKRIEIGQLNDVAAEVLGFEAEGVKGKPISMMLPEREAKILQENVEYGEEGFDVGSVLSKIPNFEVRDKFGESHACKLQAVPAQEVDGNLWFHLLLKNLGQGKKEEQLPRDVLAAQFKEKEALDEHTQLPSLESLTANMQQLEAFQQSQPLEACLAMVEIANMEHVLEWHGQKAALALHQTIARTCRQKMRGYDVVGTVSENVVGLLMLDVKPETARVVLNRLRWELMANPIELPKYGMMRLELRMAFVELPKQIGGKQTEVIAQCKQGLIETAPDVSQSSGHIFQLQAAI